MKEIKRFELLKGNAEGLLSRINQKLQKAYVDKGSFQYDPVSEVAPPELVEAEEMIRKLEPVKEKLTKVVATLRGKRGGGGN